MSFGAVAAGDAHTCGLTKSGTAYCWGYNGVGALGTGSTINSLTPVAVAEGLSFSALGAGYDHTCGLTSSGAAYCWGFNYFGQLGNGPGGGPDSCHYVFGYDGDFPCSTTPVAVVGGLSFNALALGGFHTCARTTAEAAVYCWGDNWSGQLGDSPNWWEPALVSGGLSFTDIDAKQSARHTCGLTSSEAAYCWGDNSSGELGDGSTTTSATPVAVVGGHHFIALAASGGGGVEFGYTCGLTSSGAAYCWGYNGRGQLGDGSTTHRATPVAVAGGLSFSALDAGASHACGLTSAGAAYCWGGNSYGALGNGSTTPSLVPVAVAGGLTFAALAAGALHTCALTSGGAAYCWGNNSAGELGNGSTTWSPTPVAVSGGVSFSALSSTCGLTSAGEAYCWGTPFGSSTPVAVSGGLSFSTLIPGTGCGLTTSGAIYCFGNPPRAFAEGWSFVDGVLGTAHWCGLTSSGTAYCWGSNFYGQLGRGIFDYSPVPVAVAPFGTSAAGSMRASEPFLGERCTPPVAGRQTRAERSERNPWCRVRP